MLINIGQGAISTATKQGDKLKKVLIVAMMLAATTQQAEGSTAKGAIDSQAYAYNSKGERLAVPKIPPSTDDELIVHRIPHPYPNVVGGNSKSTSICLGLSSTTTYK